LAHKTKVPVFQEISELSDEDRTLLSSADIYNTESAKQADYAYQALQKGIIPEWRRKTKVGMQDRIVHDLNDNYLFIQRYFGWHKATYVLLIRLCTLHNPFAELYAYQKSTRQTRINPFQQHKDHGEYLTFKSRLLQERPLITVVIPTLNRYPYLKDVLADLEKQTYQHFEVLVCDQSEPVDKSFYEGWSLNLTLILQTEKALWLARNSCIKAAKGEYILLFDDDSRVESDWIEQHLRCLDYFNVSISAGVTHTLVGHGLSPKETYFHLSDVFDTGNAMVRRSVFETVGLFDRQFEKQRMGDGEFGLRALLGGFAPVSNPYSKRTHLKVETGGLRQMGSWDALRPKNLLAPRPVPSVIYYIRKYFGDKQAILYIIQNVPFSFIPYKFKKSKLLKILSINIIPFTLPLILWTTWCSWRESTKKLRQGSLIPVLK
jgi:glycosyltransferase involved in cell wall biosynthesis